MSPTNFLVSDRRFFLNFFEVPDMKLGLREVETILNAPRAVSFDGPRNQERYESGFRLLRIFGLGRRMVSFSSERFPKLIES